MKNAKVAVVFPIFNGARTMNKSLDCIANQDFADFRVIIVDNKSTDDTNRIALAYCQRDSRFELVENDEHLSAVDNFARCMEIGRDAADYFCLRSCDDLSNETFLSALTDALDRNPDKLLAGPSVSRVREGKSRPHNPDPIIFGYSEQLANGTVPRSLAFPAEWCYGLFRSEVGADLMIQRWTEYPHAWCVASYAVAEFVIRDLVVWSEEAEYIFIEGSGSFEKYGAKTFREKFRQRLNYTLGCFKVVRKLPQIDFKTKIRFFRRLWRDSRAKTRYDLEDHILKALKIR
ncbi:MAG: glycosyltransferase family 2 protein [Roseibium sp.]|nr:glycosyltransferase family 2 protein [Roseibium sp.]